MLQHTLKVAEKFIQDNSPTILAGIAVVGTGATTYFGVKAGMKAHKLLADDHLKQIQNKPVGEPIDESFKHQAGVVWKEFIPVAGTATLTIACVVCANRISTRRAAALAMAYTISEKKYREYEDKIKEKLGVNKEQAARDEIASDRVRKNPPGENLVIVGDKHLILDSYTGRYFQSSIEDVKQAQNDLNYEMNHNMFASLNDFYRKIGLAPIKMGEEVGWTRDHLLEVTYSTVLADNNQPCIVLEYAVLPTRGYDTGVC